MRGTTLSPVKSQEAPKSGWNQRTPKEGHPDRYVPCQALGVGGMTELAGENARVLLSMELAM